MGGYLLLESVEAVSDSLSERIRLKAFSDVSSTELELRTLTWALSDLGAPIEGLRVYTDSQNILGLVDRRERLERNEFSSRSGERLKHAALYQEFYALLDDMGFEVSNVKGHRPSKDRSDLEKAFSLVDRLTRRELRKRQTD